MSISFKIFKAMLTLRNKKRKRKSNPKGAPYRFLHAKHKLGLKIIKRSKSYASSAKYLIVLTIWLV